MLITFKHEGLSKGRTTMRRIKVRENAMKKDIDSFPDQMKQIQ